MKKKLIAVLLIGVLSLGFVGCGRDSNGDSSASQNRFFSIDQTYSIDSSDYQIWVDSETKNMYLVNSYSEAMLPLYDADGLIQKYTK